MQLLVGRRPVRLPQGPCGPDDVRRAVQKINCPFVVVLGGSAASNRPATAGRFSVRRRVFLTAEDVRVECENEEELGLACRMISEDHNRWQQGAEDESNNRRCMQETEELEEALAARLAGYDEATGGGSGSGDEAQSDEDIGIQEWSQMGYTWFRREDVVYI